MSFRLRADAEKWFSEIQKDFTTKFDAYYFCLMAGYAAVRQSKLTVVDKQFVEDVPADYKLHQNLLLGGLIECDLRDRGISVTDRAAVQKVVSELLTANGGSTHLSGVGAARMNEYASGGFDVLTERMLDKPHKLETFLRGYAKLIAELDEERREIEVGFESE